MKKFYWIVVMALLVGAQPALATKLYKWVDEYGNVTYKDTPPTDENIKYKEKDISGGNTVEGSGADEAAEKFPVVMYSTPSCSPCNAAKAYLQSRGVPFQDKNVEGNGDLQQELKKKAGEISVPTILIGSKVMKGYVQSLLAGELDAAGYPKEGGAAGSGQASANGQSPEAQPADQGDQGDQDPFFREQNSDQQQ
jgi:glutaredoxin